MQEQLDTLREGLAAGADSAKVWCRPNVFVIISSFSVLNRFRSARAFRPHLCSALLLDREPRPCVQDNSLNYISNACMLGPKQIGPNILLSRDADDPLNLFRVPRCDVRNVSGSGKTGSAAAAAVQNTHEIDGGGTGPQAGDGSGLEGDRSQHEDKNAAQHACDGGGNNATERITVIPVRACSLAALSGDRHSDCGLVLVFADQCGNSCSFCIKGSCLCSWEGQ